VECCPASGRDEARSLIIINAAAALFIGGKAETLSAAAPWPKRVSTAAPRQ